MAKEKKTRKLTAYEVELLNTKVGKKNLFAYPNVDVEWSINRANYEIALSELQVEMIQLLNWIIANDKKVVVLFEGRDAAGKGGAIRRVTAHINQRHYRIEALPKPTEEETGQWYFQRYVNKLPKPGEIVFFDRSWYNRAVVGPVNNFCTQEEYEIFMGQVNEFERMIIESGTYLIKLYFSITKREQARRFKDIKENPLKRWKMSPVDERAQELWDEYTKYKERMFAETHTKMAPWKKIRANKKTYARLEAIKHILKSVPYKKNTDKK